MENVKPGICTECGANVPLNHEPVTVGGWYGGHEYRLDENRLAHLVDVRCEKHPNLRGFSCR